MNYNYNQPMQLPFNNKLITPPEGCKTLWAGDLHGCDENYVKSMFAHVGEVISVKLIKDKLTQQPMGYGFVEFATQYMAQQALQLNGTTVGYTGRFYRLNWAKTIPNQQPQQPNQQMPNHLNPINQPQVRQPNQPMNQPMNQSKMQMQMPNHQPVYNQHMQNPYQNIPQQRNVFQQQQQQQPVFQPTTDHNEIGEFSVFVGDLGPEVNDYMLRHAFSRYKSLASARVIYEPLNNLSKMYGFVSFNDINDYHSALAHMGGTIVGSRPIKVNTAKKEKAQLEQLYMQKVTQQYYYNQPVPFQNPNQRFNMNPNLQNPMKEPPVNDDPNNTVIYVGQLGGDTTEEDLFRLFHQYGEIKSIKLANTKECAFIEFFKRDDAKKSFALDGTILDNKKIYINWGSTTDLKTMNNRFKSIREEKTVGHIPVPTYYQQTNFQEPFNVQKSNQHYLDHNYHAVQPIAHNYLNQVVPSKTNYKSYYY